MGSQGKGRLALHSGKGSQFFKGCVELVFFHIGDYQEFVSPGPVYFFFIKYGFQLVRDIYQYLIALVMTFCVVGGL